jgi:hypothetical protein
MGGAPIVSLRTLLLLHGGSCLLGCVPKCIMTLNPKPADKNAHTHIFTPTQTHTHTNTHTHTHTHTHTQQGCIFWTSAISYNAHRASQRLCSFKLPSCVRCCRSRWRYGWRFRGRWTIGITTPTLLPGLYSVSLLPTSGVAGERERDTQHARTHGQQDAERHRDSLSLSSLCVYLGVTVYAHACVYGFVLGRSKRQSKRPSTSARFKSITLNPKS